MACQYPGLRYSWAAEHLRHSASLSCQHYVCLNQTRCGCFGDRWHQGAASCFVAPASPKREVLHWHVTCTTSALGGPALQAACVLAPPDHTASIFDRTQYSNMQQHSSGPDADKFFSVRIVSLDYYHAPPVPGLDVTFSSLEGTVVDTVPVVRVFGSTPAGQRVCLHLHQVHQIMYILKPAAAACRHLCS